MGAIHEILKQYWGYESFRPLQEEIVQSVLNGNDTLALLPTGGGKSICFQVPALAKEGICIVVSPLIALMKDQVENLKKRGVKAAAIYSGMSLKDIDILLDNCIYGEVKFLYVSPERLTTELFQERFKRMNVNLLAIDEAHCISQWGYDFRPPYLEIANIRAFFPHIPVLALTATATPEVVLDIQDKLNFKKKNVLQKSFERKNITYMVLQEEDKYGRLLKIANKIKGTGVVYVRNRRKTEEVSHFLNKNGINADFYHAGLDNAQRDKKQQEWIDNKTRIIVSTNAFGMGIDKPDVRFVVHLDLADSLEAYFQEAGRGGRDEKRAYAVQLVANSDIVAFKEQVEANFPDLDTIRKVYNSLGNYYQLAVGSGREDTYSFNIVDFCSRFKINRLKVYNSLKYIEKEGYLVLNEAVFTPSKVKMEMNKLELYTFQNRNTKQSIFIKLLLRSYSNIFDNYVKIEESELAKRSETTVSQTIERLKKLDEQGVISYMPRSTDPTIFYNEERLDNKNFRLSKKNYEDRKKVTIDRMNAVIDYVSSENGCRSQLLLAYFGEKNVKPCGECDLCLREKKQLRQDDYTKYTNDVQKVLSTPQTIERLIELLSHIPEEKLLKTVRWLIDNDKIVEEQNLLNWNK